MLVAVAAASALQDHIFLRIAAHVDDDLPGLCVLDDGSLRNLEDQIFSVPAGHFLLLAVLTVLRRIFAAVAVISQRIHSRIHAENDTAAVAAVTAIRSSCRDELLAAEGNMAVSALAADNRNGRFIYKHTNLLHFHLCRAAAPPAQLTKNSGQTKYAYPESIAFLQNYCSFAASTG